MNALDIAIESAGGVGKLAERLGIFQSAVSNWKKRGQPPADRCIALEAIAEGKVTRYQLRPDVFGPAPDSQHAA
jgi:DNA-binding transcriptional regulator YdaS (Cro superfamily)